MIEVSHLTKAYGAVRAVDDISFSIAPGEIIGFLGPNGAGKSTTMNMLTGYISATSGSITIDGHDVLESPMEAKKCIGYLPELPPLYLEMTLDEYLEFVYDLKGASQPRKKHLEGIKELTNLGHMGGRLLRNFSKGYRQRAGLAQALVGDPPVLILDEPTIGLDPAQIIEFRNVVSGLGKTTIFSTHILSEASAICSRMLIINRGKLIAAGSREEMSGENEFRYTLQLAGDADKVRTALEGIEDILELQMEEKDSTVYVSINCNSDVRPAVCRALASADVPILMMKKATPTLEEIFLRAVSGAERRTGK
ncbi:MAG: ATP-binding cassette domain-containing protein [Ruminococcaceae bacterium]|nr:ATP-binding cassette domain-containing protein [Oscillospiraceae bacterium]